MQDIYVVTNVTIGYLVVYNLTYSYKKLVLDVSMYPLKRLSYIQNNINTVSQI